MGEFGDKFRKAREKKELSLDDVSNVTKISARMLRAIEEEHFDDLPGGVFNKGFIRAYAKHLGLDAEEAVTDYLTSLRQAQIDAHEVWEPQPPTPAHRKGNGTKMSGETARKPSAPAPQTPAPVEVEELPDLHLPRIDDVRSKPKETLSDAGSGVPWRIVAAAALVLALGVFLWVRHSKKTQAAARSSQKTETLGALQSPQVPARASVPSATAEMAAPPLPTSKSVPNEAQPQTAAKPTRTALSDSVTPAGKNGEPSDVTVKNFGKPVAKATEKAAPALSLVIRAAENSWISAFADGQLVTQETLIAPAHTSIRASREITLRVGNAAGVSFLFNGQEIPAQGGEAEVKNVTFDSNGMHVSAAAPATPQSP